MRPVIEILYPEGSNEKVELSRERTVIGRSTTAHIRINDSRVSREHCVLEVDGERVYIVDLGGSNGTWVGATKILPNVREPFPHDLIVHVGPAQLRNVTARLDPSNDLESRAFMPVVPQRAPRDGGRAAGPVSPSTATIELVESRLKLAPGERGSLLLNISNQSKIVDHYTLSITGVPNTWVTLPRAGLELLPRQSGALSVDFHPPRHSRTSAGVHPLSIALLDRQGEIVTQTVADLEIAPFDNMVLDVRPNPYQSRSGGELTLTVENQGNAQTEYRVTVLEQSNALEIVVDPPVAQVAPQQSRESAIRLRPRQRLWMGQPRRMMMTVTVTSNLQSVTANPVYTQLALIPYWVPILLVMACCVLVPLFTLMAVPPLMGEYDKRQAAAEGTRVAPLTAEAATQTAQPTVTPTPDFGATATAEWFEQDCYGMTYREKWERDLEICHPDTDRDGLDDYDEIYVWGTDPKDRDTSGDGMSDGEVVRLINEGQPGKPREWYACLNPKIADANNDGTTNQQHVLQDTNPCSGAAPTPTPPPTPVRGFALGGHVNNRTDNLSVLKEAGMTWVKVQLRYSPGADPQSTVRDYQEYKSQNLMLLVSVVGHPEDILAGGTAFFQQFAEFLAQVASVADAIEVWNEPNIDEEWPEGQIDPAMYTQMLRYAYTAIKASYPTTLVISAAPAPTGLHIPTNVWDDGRYIQGMAQARAYEYMDCVGVHFNAGATAPSETSGHPADDGQRHHSWYFLPMMELYWNTFNPPGSNKTVDLCFTEIGFVTDEGMPQTLAQAGASGFLWGANIRLYDQGVWLSDALQRACHSGKVRLFIVWNVDFETYGTDPQAGYAILRPDGRCPSCAHLQDALLLLRQQNCM
jgi:hypothetical protein